MTVELSEIKVVEMECMKCYCRQTVFLQDQFNGNGRCPRCGATWPVHGIAAFQGLQQAFSQLLLQLTKVNNDRNIPFTIRFELSVVPELDPR
jgi:hypothetical protein